MKSEKNLRIQFGILFALSFLVYFNTLFNQFALDDTLVLTSNKYTQDGLKGIGKIFSSDAFEGFYGESKNLLSGGRYRPLSQALLNVEYSLFGMHAFPYHLLNVLLYSLCMLLLFKVLRKLFVSIKSENLWLDFPFIVSLIVAVHPIHTEVVANIKSIDLILALGFILLMINHSLKYLESQKNSHLILLIFYFFLGILSKENVLTFLLALPLVLLYFKRPTKTQWLKITAALIVGALAYFILRISLLGMPTSVKITELLNDPFLNASFSEKYATVFYTWFIYLKLLIFPYPLTHDYYPFAIEIQQFTNPIVLLSVLIFLSAGFWAMYRTFQLLIHKKPASIYAFGILFFLIVFSISSNFFVNIGAFMNERFVFIADIGLIIIFVWFVFNEFSQKILKLNNQALYFIFGLILFSFSTLTIARNTAWFDDFTLFTTDVKTSVNSAKCNVSAGGKCYEKALVNFDQVEKNKLLLDAENYLQHGISIHPSYIQAYWLLGNVFFEELKLKEAFLTYKNALILSPSNNDLVSNMRNLGLKAKMIKNDGLSIEIFSYLSTNYYKSEYQYQIADIYASKNNFDTALAILNALIIRDSIYDEAYNKMGEIYGRFLNNMPASEKYLLKAFAINPSNTSVLENLGVLNASLNRFDQALIYFNKSLQIKPDNKQLLLNMALLYKNMGDLNKSKEFEQRANVCQ